MASDPTPGGGGRANMALPQQLLGDEGIDGAHQGLPIFGQADLLLAATDDRSLDLVLPRLEGDKIGVAEGGSNVVVLPEQQLLVREGPTARQGRWRR